MLMLAEGNLCKELHTAIRILTTKDRTMTKLSAKRFTTQKLWMEGS